MMRICFFGIAISTFALTLVAAIMTGFEKATHEKLQGINTDIIIRSEQCINYEKVDAVLKQDYNHLVAASSPQSLGHALISNEDEASTPAVVIIIGIDPDKQAATSTLATTIREPQNKAFSSLFHNRSLIIGEQLAHLLGTYVGDPVSLLFAPQEEPTSKTVTLSRSKAIIGGIFKTGIDEYDTNVIFCSKDLFADLFPEAGITTIGIKVRASTDASKTLLVLKKRFSSLQVYSWKDLYPAIVEALALEKFAMVIILILISLMASMSIVSLLFMIVTHKRADIAILATMGMSQSNIGTIFILMGMGVAMAATITGLTLALGASWLLTTYQLIKLPDAYYVSHLPAHVSWPLVGAVLGITTLLSFLATWLPARRASKLNTSAVLKSEG